MARYNANAKAYALGDSNTKGPLTNEQEELAKLRAFVEGVQQLVDDKTARLNQERTPKAITPIHHQPIQTPTAACRSSNKTATQQTPEADKTATSQVKSDIDLLKQAFDSLSALQEHLQSAAEPIGEPDAVDE